MNLEHCGTSSQQGKCSREAFSTHNFQELKHCSPTHIALVLAVLFANVLTQLCRYRSFALWENGGGEEASL
jgi:hypothetical protein